MKCPINVLILEDKATDVEWLLYVLELEGFEVQFQWVNSKQGYLAALNPTFELILADETMPELDAKRAYTLMRERGLDISFLTVAPTGNGSLIVHRVMNAHPELFPPETEMFPPRDESPLQILVPTESRIPALI